MWQAPTLTIAAQAFLLFVLTNSSINACARASVLAAGITAGLAALLSLLRLREREIRYSDAIAYSLNELGISDPRPDDLPRLELDRSGVWPNLDRFLRTQVARDWVPPIHFAWCVALVLFIVADVVAYVLTT